MTDANIQSLLATLATAALDKAEAKGSDHVTLASLAKRASKALGPFSTTSVTPAVVAGALRALSFDVSGGNVYRPASRPCPEGQHDITDGKCVKCGVEVTSGPKSLALVARGSSHTLGPVKYGEER